MPYFVGARVQQGYGLGNLFSSIAKSVLPLVKKGAKILEKQVLQSGVEFASDVLHGKNAKQAASIKQELLVAISYSGPTKNRKAKSSTKKSTEEETQEIPRHFLVNHGDVSTSQFGRIHHSQLNLFSVPPSQTSLEEGSFTEYHPVSVLTFTGPIEFTISAENSNYIDLANSFLYVRASVTTAAGVGLAKNVKIAPECNFLLHLRSGCLFERFASDTIQQQLSLSSLY